MLHATTTRLSDSGQETLDELPIPPTRRIPSKAEVMPTEAGQIPESRLLFYFCNNLRLDMPTDGLALPFPSAS